MALRKLVVILNGVSRKKKRFYSEILPDLQTHFDVSVWETQHRDHAIELARKACDLNPFGILAAGGDGTLNQVLNGVLNLKSQSPPIGIIPMGTGNDFARLNGINSMPGSIVEKINEGGRPTDVGLISCVSESGEKVTRYFINVASVGMGPEVVRRLFKSNRILGPTLTYAKTSIETFFSHRPDQIEVKSDTWSWNGKVRVFAVANGKSFGGGLYVAPDSEPDDGLLSTFIAGEIPTMRFLWLLQQIKSPKKIPYKLLEYNSCKHLRISSERKIWIETEGELAGLLPASAEVIPQRIQFFR